MVLANFKSLKDLQGLFWKILTDVVNDENVQIRRSWQMGGAPDWKLEDTVLFIQVHEETGYDISQPLDQILADLGEDFLQTSGFTRVIRLNVIGYGDLAYFYITKIRHAIYNGLKALRKEQIYLVPEPDSIQSVPELFQGRWWPRTNLDIKFNTLVTFDADINAVKEVDATIGLNHSGNSEVVLVDNMQIIANK